ncbi:MAG: ribose-phosphate pyrophosphokinase [Actinomycetia bacterium]|nr:ribose-phosphate pyrophosphokinase [Actinomycetes bacterium]
MPHVPRGTLSVFCGNSHCKLGETIAEFLKKDIGEAEISQFSNGEIYVRYLESVRGADAFVIQTIHTPVNRNLMELLIMIDALKRASAERITAVIPHYGYARQDKKATAREPITAKLVADLLERAGIDRFITMDLHAGQIQGFFSVPVDHLTAVPLLSEYFRVKNLKDMVVVAPDVGRVKTAKRCADFLNAPLAILHKTRPKHNIAEITHVVGEVKGKVAILIDDMIDTGGTIVNGAKALAKDGAVQVFACATHAVLSGPAIKRLEESNIKEIVLTDTIPLQDDKKIDKIKVLSVASLFGQTIYNVHEDISVSQLFGGPEHV